MRDPSPQAGVPTLQKQSALMMIPGLVLSSVLVLRPLEIAFPAKFGLRLFRSGWFTDFCFILSRYLVWNGAIIWLMAHFAGWIDGFVPAHFRAAVATQPWWARAVEVVVLSDFCVYWGHRLQHSSRLLWRFHAIHHSSEHLDWLATYREHPIDTLYRVGLVNLPVFILGFPLGTLMALIAFRDIWALYLHSNVRLPIGPLRILIGAPELHHWHHGTNREVGNYANNSPLIDMLFGTYLCPDREPEAMGLNEPIRRSYLGYMLHPFMAENRRQPDSGSEMIVNSVAKELPSLARVSGTG
jgi:sterol desaturase/sphingolipid hydroxylase (fatty acid hydroxylase superfamily)